MNTLDLVAAELSALDENRPRSQQITPGASQAGSCRAALLFRSTGAMPTDPRLKLAALIGTAVHSMCESAADPATTLLEQKFTYRGVPATVDRYDYARHVLCDIKTKATPEKIAALKHAGTVERRYLWQIMLGAAALIEAGHSVESVELLYIPRSGGDINDCWLWSAPFDLKIADEAADWMQVERERADALGHPAESADVDGLRDESYFFCSAVCEYFTACRGEQDLGPSQDDLADAARRFQEAKDLEAIAKSAKSAATKELYGYTGLAGEFKVRTVSDSSSPVLDIDAVKAREDEWRFVFGEGLPTKESTRRGYVTVTRAAK